LFVDSGNPIVLPPVDEMSTGSGIYRAFISSKHKTAPAILLKAEHVGAGQALVGKGLSGVVIVTKALPHARIRALPGDVAELLTQYRELGVDLLNPLRDHFKSWIGNQFINQLLAQQCVVVIRTPIERTPGIVGGEAAKAFLTECTAEQLADKLGALWRQDDTIGSVLLPSPPDMDALRTLTLHPMDVHRPFDRAMAQAASGIAGDAEHARAITLVGAGALGSQMVMTAARMGMGRWTIVDDDHILPHNLGRYALTRRYLGWAKAEAVAREIKLLLGVGSATAVVGRIDDGETGAVSLATAELVIDASASVPVARWLATASTHVGRTISVFVNPTGHDLVVLAEGADRMPRLDHVEMSYYWMLVTTPSLMGHLSGGGVGLYPSGGCRQASLRLSQADMATLAATAAKRAVEATPPTEGTIEIWRTGDDGVTVERARPTLFRDIELAGWKVSFSELVLQGIRDERVSAGGEETGGILIGTWDRSRRRAYIVGHCSAPPDSVATRTGFVRGMVGVFKTLDEVEKSTAANLTYVGEWHTHPPGFASTPSSDDKLLLEWIEHVLIFSDVPPLMLIAGEDGVRALLGTAANSCLMPSRPPES